MRIPALFLIAPSLLAAQTPAATFLPPTWTSAEGFSGIRNVRELSDGRVIMIDWKDNRLILISATGTTVGDIARVGAGPGEFRQPVGLIALPKDSTAVIDQELRRVLFLDGAKPVTTTLFPPEFSPGVLFTRAADAAGRFVFMPSWVSTRTDGAAELLPILAWDRKTNRADTLGLALAQKKVTRELTFPGGGRGSSTFPIRFSPLDEWALLSTGEVAILHSEPYAVDIFMNGKARVKGAPVPYDRVKVEASERVPAAVAQDIPEFKGAFGNNGGAFAGPNGDIWMLRSISPSAKVRTYDRFDRTARRTHSLTVDRAIVLVGFGREAMYTARTDADGLQWLEKRPIPR